MPDKRRTADRLPRQPSLEEMLDELLRDVVPGDPQGRSYAEVMRDNLQQAAARGHRKAQAVLPRAIRMAELYPPRKKAE